MNTRIAVADRDHISQRKNRTILLCKWGEKVNSIEIVSISFVIYLLQNILDSRRFLADSRLNVIYLV